MRVDGRTGLVATAGWSYPKPASPKTGEFISEAQARAAAGRFLRETAKLPVSDESLKVIIPPRGAGPTVNCTAVGHREDRCRYWVMLELDAYDARPGGYVCSISAPEPAATSPILLTEAQALAAVRDYAQRVAHARIVQVEPSEVRTDSQYAELGVPVYEFLVGTASLADRPGAAEVTGAMWAVNAATGEVLTERIFRGRDRERLSSATLQKGALGP